MISPSSTPSFSRLYESGLDFFLWWKSEMLRLVPAGMQRRMEASQRAGRQLTITKSGYSLDGETVQPLSTLGDALLTLKAGGTLDSRGVRLVLDETRYLERAISQRRLPLSLLRRAAEFDVLTETPFRVEDVKILVSMRSGREATYYVVRCDVLEEIKRQLSRASVEVSGVYLGRRQIEVMSGPRPAGFANGKRRNIGKSFDFLLMFLIVLAGLFCIYQIDQKTTAAAAKLDWEISEADTQAHAARSKFDLYAKKVKQLQALKAKQAETLEVVQTWEELSRILPDTAFLTDLVIKHDTMELTGFSTTPAALISSIEGSPLFAGARFGSPVVKIPGFDGDYFLISFEREQG